MRKHAGSWIIKFILGAVVLAFIPFGYGIYQDKRDTEVATVNGDPIYYEDYNRLYNNLVDQMRRSFGDSLNEELIKTLRLKDQALNQLIDQKLLLDEAERLGLSISDQELAEAIGKIEAFQTAGVFDNRRYEYILDRNRLTKEMFESDQKQALVIDKLRSYVTSNTKVSDMEAKEWHRWNDASVNIDYVLFSPSRYQGIEATEEELKAYFEEHKADYKTDEKRKARYIHFNPEKFKPDIKITEETLREYYDAYPAEFHTPKTVEARHILIRVGQDADEQTVEKAKQRAEDTLKLAREGNDFADLAVKYSEGPTSRNGGFLGAFKKDAMVKPFSDKAFSMKTGEISEPVRTQFGWHIIKVEKINEASTIPFDTAREKISKKLINERANNLAYDEAEMIYDASFEVDDLLRNAAERKLTVRETDFFTNKGPDKGVTDRTTFAEVAFKLSLMDISEIQELKDGFYIIQVFEKLPPQIPELKDVSSKVKAELIKEKQGDEAGMKAEAFLAALKEGKSMADESVRYGLKPESTGFFKRNADIPNIGFDRELAAAAFALSGANKLPDKVYKVNDSYYVIQFVARKVPAPDNYEKEKDKIMENLQRQKQVQTMDKWLAEKRKNSEIMIEENYLQ